MIADVLRVLTILICISAAIGFPLAIAKQGRRDNAWLAVYGCEVLVWSGMVEVFHRFGRPIAWYRTPMILLASLLICAYCVLVFREHYDV